jgi:GWxTD domain-containing protein
VQFLVKFSLENSHASRVSHPIWIRRKIGRTTPPIQLQNIIGPMQYIMRTEDWHRLKKASGPQQKKLFQEFWDKRNPLPDSDTNPLLKEFYRRVEYANEHFSNNIQPGWKTDLGRVYIIYGPPDDIYRNEGDLFSNQPPYIIWTYYNLRLRFVFVDENNTGDYRLVSQENY